MDYKQDMDITVWIRCYEIRKNKHPVEFATGNLTGFYFLVDNSIDQQHFPEAK